MRDQLIDRLRAAIKDSELAGPKHGVVISKVDAKRLLYRLIREQNNPQPLVYRKDVR